MTKGYIGLVFVFSIEGGIGAFYFHGRCMAGLNMILPLFGDEEYLVSMREGHVERLTVTMSADMPGCPVCVSHARVDEGCVAGAALVRRYLGDGSSFAGGL